MKNFLFKLFLISLPAIFLLTINYYCDTFNVFHWNNIRFCTATPNDNYIKTQYIIHNPDKFNAFIFGSSRVENIPPNELPEVHDGNSINWYNLWYSEGIPAEHLLTIKTFLKNNVKIDTIILGFDYISMYASINTHKKELIKIPFQVYEDNKIAFFNKYFRDIPSYFIIREVFNYNKATHTNDKEYYYTYGTKSDIQDFSLNENPDINNYIVPFNMNYSEKDSWKDIKDISDLCKQNGIHLILFTNPLYKTTYLKAVSEGYFDFLKNVAESCEFYNFSTLNNYTKNPEYYYEWSHYRPILGLILEKYLFGTDQERVVIRKDAGDELFGIKVNSQNIDTVLEELSMQLKKK